jgi:hypothetical protein
MNQIYIFSEKRSNRLAYMARTMADRLGVPVEECPSRNISMADNEK